MSNAKNKERDLEKLQLYLKKLEVEKTPRKDFEKAYEKYKKNWKKLLINS